MNDFRLYDVRMLHLLWLVPLLGLIAWRAFRKRREALARFAQHPLVAAAAGDSVGRRRLWKSVLTLTAVGLLAFAVARPAWNRIPQEVTQRGRDVVFILDVSRSMLAEDLRPNRLERAKLAILDAVSRLSGDRVALIAFAGLPSIKAPLTIDYGFFRMALEELEPDSVPRGGTMIGDALRKAIHEIFDDKQSQYRDIILITDGEDHDSFPVDAAKEAGALGVRLIAIGLGDENVGRRIPFTNQRGERTFLQYKGQEVWSRLDAKTLREMAAATPGGRYLNVATGAIDFGDIYARLVASADRRDVETRTIERYEEKFQIFVGLAFLLLLGELLISEYKLRPPAAAPASKAAAAGRASTRAAAILLIALAPASLQLQAASARALVSEGNRAYESAAYDDALGAYRQAATEDPDAPTARFNEGAALYRQEQYDEAVAAYLDAAQLAREAEDARLEARSRFNLGNAFVRQSAPHAEADPRQALDYLRKSSAAYKQALNLDPSLSAAAENLELTRRTMRELLERMRNQPPQDSQGGDESQDLSKQLQEQIEKQQQLNQDREQAEQQQDQQSPQQQQQQREQLADRQDELQQQSQQMSQEAQQQQTPQASEAREQLEQAAQRQKEAAEQLRQDQLDQAEQSQDQAAQNLQQALDALRGESDRQGDQQPQNAEQQPQPSQQPPQQQAEQSPLQTLQLTPQDILNEEQANRRRRALEALGRRPTVEKDW